MIHPTPAISQRGDLAVSTHQLTPGGALLGESPRWDSRTGRALWVDLWGGLLHATDPASGETETRDVGAPLSAVVLTTRGTAVVTQGLHVLELTDNGLRDVLDLPEREGLRTNDASVDAAGRLWVGTMFTPGREGAAGSLWRWEPGEREAVRVLDDVLLANGIGWSPAGDRLFFVDSTRQRVTAYPFDVATGRLGGAEPFVQVPSGAGLPDGLAVAADGSVWLALAGGGAVHRYDAEGALLERIELPVQYPTSCAFGGPSLTDLLVTTGSRQLPSAIRGQAVADGAGALFRVDAGVAGLAPNRLEIP